jgi:hypothetical protein
VYQLMMFARSGDDDSIYYMIEDLSHILCRSAVIVSPSDNSAEFEGFSKQSDHVRPPDHEENQSCGCP